MNGKWPSILLRVFFILAVLNGPITRNAHAQLVPAGPETRVDTVPAGPTCPHLAVAPDGSSEIAWDYSGFTPFTVEGRHYAPDGTPTDPQQVRLGSVGSFYDTTTAYLVSPVSSGFQVLFHHFDETLENPPVIRRQLLDPAGQPVGTSGAVGDTATRWVWPGPGDILYAGSYKAAAKTLVLWQVGPTGKPTGPKIVVNERPIDAPNLRIVPLNGQEFVAVWNGISVAKRGAPARQVIRARRFRLGAPQGKEIDVNVARGGAPGMPPFLPSGLAVAADPAASGFAVAWGVADAAGTATPNASIRLRFFGAPGRPAGPEVMATPGGQGVTLAGAAFDDAGKLLLLWRPPIRTSLRARLFQSTGPVSPVFQVNSPAAGPFDLPACGDLAWNGDSWLVSWRAGRSDQGLDGGAAAIFLRRFAE
jgi:hypothetical protein